MRFWRRTPEPEEEPVVKLRIERPVWFFLIGVRVTGNGKQPWIAGSEALVQVFVPAVALEDALAALDKFLPSQELERIDTRRADRFEPNEDDSNIPGEYFLEPLQQAARSNECTVGIFVVSRDSAWPHADVM